MRYKPADGGESANALYKKYQLWAQGQGKQPLPFKEWIAEAKERGLLSADGDTPAAGAGASAPAATTKTDTKATDTKKDSKATGGMMDTIKKNKKMFIYIGLAVVVVAGYFAFVHKKGKAHHAA